MPPYIHTLSGHDTEACLGRSCCTPTTVRMEACLALQHLAYRRAFWIFRTVYPARTHVDTNVSVPTRRVIRSETKRNSSTHDQCL
ncbi:hypothetical protein HBI25_178610 [Parastagonospora nodorum]|nr:hypothetical protein HBH53_048660 [Parastagonospora nodorum]KAH4049754.1 hypothetical protein HBH49_137030 [Parastagonospora nodorum]KAH4075567.1 hypothetical protein HBH50_018450 [Parastagonospora nodorum]KAH4098128.1 hypothetical protein HBH48_028850 [Parastagonospora nodorum]KAH4201400.1 hypothetical protein HBH42_028980 [Parastagonospora nodorum]